MANYVPFEESTYQTIYFSTYTHNTQINISKRFYDLLLSSAMIARREKYVSIPNIIDALKYPLLLVPEQVDSA